jgi:hypothetical protein
LRPTLVELDWPRIYRLIPSKFPPIDLFENLVDAKDFEQLCMIEMLTNPRLKEQLAGINLIKPDDIVTGRGSTVVMAASHTSIKPVALPMEVMESIMLLIIYRLL